MAIFDLDYSLGEDPILKIFHYYYPDERHYIKDGAEKNVPEIVLKNFKFADVSFLSDSAEAEQLVKYGFSVSEGDLSTNQHKYLFRSVRTVVEINHDRYHESIRSVTWSLGYNISCSVDKSSAEAGLSFSAIAAKASYEKLDSKFTIINFGDSGVEPIDLNALKPENITQLYDYLIKFDNSFMKDDSAKKLYPIITGINFHEGKNIPNETFKDKTEKNPLIDDFQKLKPDDELYFVLRALAKDKSYFDALKYYNRLPSSKKTLNFNIVKQLYLSYLQITTEADLLSSFDNSPKLQFKKPKSLALKRSLHSHCNNLCEFAEILTSKCEVDDLFLQIQENVEKDQALTTEAHAKYNMINYFLEVYARAYPDEQLKIPSNYLEYFKNYYQATTHSRIEYSENLLNAKAEFKVNFMASMESENSLNKKYYCTYASGSDTSVPDLKDGFGLNTSSLTVGWNITAGALLKNLKSKNEVEYGNFHAAATLGKCGTSLSYYSSGTLSDIPDQLQHGVYDVDTNSSVQAYLNKVIRSTNQPSSGDFIQPKLLSFTIKNVDLNSLLPNLMKLNRTKMLVLKYIGENKKIDEIVNACKSGHKPKDEELKYFHKSLFFYFFNLDKEDTKDSKDDPKKYIYYTSRKPDQIKYGTQKFNDYIKNEFLNIYF